MKKTYKANKNHPFLKEGMLVEYSYFGGWYYTPEGCGDEGMRDTFNPEKCTEWYDEVVEEPTSSEWVNGVIGACKKLREIEEPTVSDDDVNKILNELVEENYDGTLIVDPDKLAAYFAKLEKRITK